MTTFLDRPLLAQSLDVSGATAASSDEVDVCKFGSLLASGRAGRSVHVVAWQRSTSFTAR